MDSHKEVCPAGGNRLVEYHLGQCLLGDASLFSQARIDARGGYVVWIDDDLELAADNLRNMAIEQSGGLGHERL